ncbi:MAG: SDR family NAD(P)-dependent oxidoreductase [Gammaproteobacteria bacterium]|nr:SDR family NAD(P)-dependent oxidoreductase [Gammaproteobacteria bacterium]
MLKNKIILITGATRGIGQQLALTCAKNGATVIALGKNKKRLEQLYTQIMGLELDLSEPSLLPFNLAGATPSDYENLANLIAEQYGRLDGLVHNAAILGIKTELIHYDILKWYETIQVNLNAPFLLTKALLPILKLAKQSSIIFTTANEGLVGQAYQGAYGITKAGIKNFMEILAAELETYNNKIRVNAINPNLVYSGIYTQNFPAIDPCSVPNVKDIMPLYLTLLGDFSQYIHGQTIKFN